MGTASRVTSPRHQLGKLGFLGGGCCADLWRSGVGALVASGVGSRCSPWFPAGSGTRMARSLRLDRSLAELGPGVSEPQPTTVSHDGGRADRPRTRVLRCTPTGLSHAAMPSTRASHASGSMAVGPWVRTSSFRGILGCPLSLGCCACHLHGWSADVYSCSRMCAVVVTQIDTHRGDRCVFAWPCQRLPGPPRTRCRVVRVGRTDGSPAVGQMTSAVP